MTQSSTSSTRLVVVAPTFYKSLTESRFLLAKQTCEEAAKYNVRLILIDASPLKEQVWDELRKAGTSSNNSIGDETAYVTVIEQQAIGKKGVALREGIAVAVKQLDEYNDTDDQQEVTHIIGFQEPEKVDMIRHWNTIVKHMTTTPNSNGNENGGSGGGYDIVLPKRSDKSFRDTYPIEQYYAEIFGNMYLNTLGSQIGLPNDIDWTIGPVAFHKQYAKYWLDYTGDVWDAQLVPIIRAFVMSNNKINILSNIEIDYQHPKIMKNEEEQSSEWCEKRLHQLQFLKDTVGKELKEVAVLYGTSNNSNSSGDHDNNKNDSVRSSSECFLYNCP